MCWKKHREKCQKHTSYNNLLKKNVIIKALPLVTSSSEGREDTFNSERIK